MGYWYPTYRQTRLAGVAVFRTVPIGTGTRSVQTVSNRLCNFHDATTPSIPHRSIVCCCCFHRCIGYLFWGTASELPRNGPDHEDCITSGGDLAALSNG